jgi:hypothetical protein
MFKIICLDDFNYADICQDAGATIYTSIDDFAFPDSTWFDLPISVLIMWGANVIENYAKKNKTFVLYFMDGPYYIECHKKDKRIHLKCIVNKEEKIVVCESNIEMDILVKELAEVSEKTIRNIESYGCKSVRHFEDLRKTIESLKNLIYH